MACQDFDNLIHAMGKPSAANRHLDHELKRLLDIAHDLRHPLDIDEGLTELAENALDVSATQADKQNAIDYLARAIRCHRGGTWHNWLADGTCTDCTAVSAPINGVRLIVA